MPDPYQPPRSLRHGRGPLADRLAAGHRGRGSRRSTATTTATIRRPTRSSRTSSRPTATGSTTAPTAASGRRRPSLVGADFTPYYTGGHWVLTEFGWTWVSDWSWGWAPFHYGRWIIVSGYGWCWVPGSDVGPGVGRLALGRRLRRLGGAPAPRRQRDGRPTGRGRRGGSRARRIWARRGRAACRRATRAGCSTAPRWSRTTAC